MGICYLVGAGEFAVPFVPGDEDYVVAADGGYDSLVKHGIRCDLLVGDLDSLSTPPTGVKILRFPVEKDDTDMFLAYKEGRKKGYTDFAIYGGGGGREDHTFANYCLLYAIKRDGCNAKMVNAFGDIYALKSEKKIFSGEGKEGKHFSVFPFMGICSGVTIRGLKYRTDEITLRPEFPYTVSNLFTGSDAEVSVKEGILLVMIER